MIKNALEQPLSKSLRSMCMGKSKMWGEGLDSKGVKKDG